MNLRRYRCLSTPADSPVRRLAAICLLAWVAGCEPPNRDGPRLDTILAEAPAERLSDYGFFVDEAGREPADGLLSYDLINPLFSDYASKHRYVFIPDGQPAAYRDDDVFDFPVGSVLIKTFAFAPDMRSPEVGERFVETRLLIRARDGWKAYPYVWNADQSEAYYSPVGMRTSIKTLTPSGEAVELQYAVPNQNQCKTCHQSGQALAPIGPTARSLNHEGPAGTNQIAHWTSLGMLTGAPSPEVIPAAPHTADVSRSVEERARAYLDINCSHCHKADGGASNSGLFLRWTEEDPVGWGVRKHPTAAGRGAGQSRFVIEPGRPDESILLYRMESTEPGVLMPELGRSVVDEAGVRLVREWIASMPQLSD
jgi:uncharacterized repeat protein (TIGR03806 family)